jgi:hypothetical protein
MNSYNPIQNVKNYVSGSHRLINIGTGTDATPTNTLVTLTKRIVMTIESCNIGIGTTLPRETLDVIGNTYISQNIGIGTTIIGSYGLNVVGNVYSSGTITAVNYIGGSSTLTGTLLTSNLTVLGSNTINNTYTQQSSNFSICNVSGTGPALSVIQKGSGIEYPIADFYDLDVSTTVPSFRIADGGNVGIGTSTPIAKLHVHGNVYNSANIGIGTTIIRNKLDVSGDIIVSGNIGIGTTLPRALLHIGAGTTTVAPLQFTSGTNLTTVVAGSIEYDGIKFYGTPDTTSGSGYLPNIQIFRLTADGSAVGPTIANYFGSTSAINLIAGGIYEIEAFCWFLKTTSGTVTITLTTTQSVINLDGTIDFGAPGGGTVNGVGQRVSLHRSATTANVFPVSSSLTNGANHALHIRAIIEANAANNSTLTINFTEGAGTITPFRGSYYIVTRLPSGNSGIFSA